MAKIKRLISVVLIVSVIFTTNAMFTLADSIDDLTAGVNTTEQTTMEKEIVQETTTIDLYPTDDNHENDGNITDSPVVGENEGLEPDKEADDEDTVSLSDMEEPEEDDDKSTNNYDNNDNGIDTTCYNVVSDGENNDYSDTENLTNISEATDSETTYIDTYSNEEGEEDVATISETDEINDLDDLSNYNDINEELINENRILGANLSGATTTYYYLSDENTVLHLTIVAQSGTNKGVYSSSSLNSTKKNAIVKLVIDDEIAPTSCSSWFNNYYNLATISNIENFVTSNVTNMQNMFQNCRSLTYLDLSGFDTAKVKNSYMTNFLKGCSSLRGVNLTGLNTNLLTNMSSFFEGCSSLTYLDLSTLNTGAITSFSKMFYGCESLTQINFGDFNTVASTDMSYMFYGCSNLNDVNLNSFNTAKVTNMLSMFEGCSSLLNIDLASFNVNKVSNMKYMFKGCANLQNINFTGFTQSSVSYFYAEGMFSGCENLLSVDLSAFGPKVYSTIDMFKGCSSIQSIDISNFNMTNTSSTQSMFEDCSALTDLNIGNMNTINVMNMSMMFKNCSALTSLELSNINVANVTNFNEMFKGMTSLTSLNISGFDTSNATSMVSMFENDTNLVNLDVSSFNTSYVTSMKLMFGGLENIESIDTSQFNTNALTDASYMFNNVKKVSSLNLSSFTIKNTTNISGMFNGCLELETIIVSDNFNCSNDVSIEMFNNCTNLVGENGTRYQDIIDNKNTALYAKIDNHEGIGYFTYFQNDTFTLDRVEIASVSYVTDYMIGEQFIPDGLAIRFVYKDNSEKIIRYNTSNSKNFIFSVDTFYEYMDFVDVTYKSYTVTMPIHMERVYWYVTDGGTKLHLSSTKPTNSNYVDGNDDYTTDSLLYNDKQQIVEIIFDNVVKPRSCVAWFIRFSNLETITNLSNLDTSKVHDMREMFRYCYKLPSFDFHAITLTNMVDMEGMMEECKSLVSVDMSNINLSNLVSMKAMFAHCEKLETITLYASNLSKLENIEYMFWDCPKLANANFDDVNTEKIYRIDGMFHSCSSLTGFDMSKLNTVSLVNMREVFVDCIKLESMDFSQNDLSKVTGMSNLFKGCTNLQSVSFENANLESLQYMGGMFLNCASISEIDLSMFYQSEGYLEYSDDIFDGCINLKKLNISNWNFSLNGPYSNDMLSYKNTHMDKGIFKTLSSLEELDMSNVKLGNISRISFNDSINNYNESIKKIDLSNMESNSLTDLSSAFKNCKNLVELKFDNFMTGNVTSMNSMFYNCEKLVELDLSGFSTDNVRDMKYMFNGCKELIAIRVSSMFTTANVTIDEYGDHSSEMNAYAYSYEMFGECEKLVGGQGTICTGVSSGDSDPMICVLRAKLDGGNTSLTSPGYFQEGSGAIHMLYLDWFDAAENAGISKSSITKIKFQLGGNAPATGIYNETIENSNGLILIINEGIATIYAFGSNDLIYAYSKMGGTGYGSGQDGTFSMFTNITEIENLTSLSTSRMTNINYMFFMCERLLTVDVSNFDISRAYKMDNTFYGCHSLREITGIGLLDTSNMISLDSTFENCENIEDLNLSNWNVIKVTNASRIFQGMQGLKNINISGWNLSRLNSFNAMFSGLDQLKTIDMSYVNVSNVTDMSYLFEYCDNLMLVNMQNMVIDNVSNMRGMFNGCYNLRSINLGSFNTSNVTDMSRMFNDCYTLESIDLSTFNTSNVTSMRSMFSDCYSLINLNISNFNTSRVTDMAYMFYSCKKMEALDLSNFDTSSCTDMSYMFSYCHSLRNVNLLSFNTSNVTTMYYMFYDCLNLETLDLSSFNTGKVINMSSMFEFCYELKDINISGFNTERVVSMSHMFAYCRKLESIDLSSFNTSVNRSFENMFYDNRSLINLDLSCFTIHDTANTDLMLYGTVAIQNLSVSVSVSNRVNNILTFGTWKSNSNSQTYAFDQNNNVTTLPVGVADTYILLSQDFYNMYWYMVGDGELHLSKSHPTASQFVEGQIINEYSLVFRINRPWMNSDIRKVYIDDTIKPKHFRWFSLHRNLEYVDMSNLDTCNMVSFQQLFMSCRSLRTVNFGNIDMSPIKKMNQMFHYCTSLESIDFTGMDTRNVETMVQMFYRCTSLQTVNMSNLDLNKVTSMINMFWYCNNLQSVNLSNTRAENATNLDRLFSDCISLTNVNLSGFTLSKVVEVDHMFYNCRSIENITIDATAWDVRNVTTVNSMFEKCSMLQRVNWTGLNFSAVKNTNNLFYDCSELLYVDMKCFTNSSTTFSSSLFYNCYKLQEIEFNYILSKYDLTRYNIYGDWKNVDTGDVYVYNNQTHKVTVPTNISGHFVKVTDGRCEVRVKGYQNRTQIVDSGNVLNPNYILTDLIVGLYTDSSRTTEFDFSTPITEDKIFYPKLVETISGAEKEEYCAVVFVTYGGSYVETLTLRKGEILNEPVAPTRDGYVFDSWQDYEDTSGSPDPYVFGEEVYDQYNPIVLYAKWSGGTRQLTSISVENPPTSTSYIVGQTFNPAGLRIKLNYNDTTVEYVDYNSTTMGNFTFMPNTELASNVTQIRISYGGKSCYLAITMLVSYEVGYNMMGHGDTISSASVISGSLITAPTAPTVNGYTFGGWYKEAALENAWNFNTDTVASNTTLYAKWTPKTYTITYNASDGSVTPTSFTKTFDTVYAGDLAVPTKTGYTFDGWYSDGLYTVIYDKNTDAIYSEGQTAYTIYAKWTANTYNVEFNVGSSGATAPAAITKTYAAALASELPNPTNIPDGYEFLGWYKESTFNNKWNGAANDDLSSTAGATVTVYAKWRMGIVYNANGHGTAPETKTITGTETYNLPTMTATGYTFGGWYEEADCNNLVGLSGASYTATAAKTLYAKWTAKTYTITYNVNDGTITGDTSFTKTYDTAYAGELAVPTKTGYTFAGWYSDNTTFNNSYDKTTDAIYVEGTNTYTIFAKWTAKTYTVNYVANEGIIAGSVSFEKTYGTAFSPALSIPTRTGYTFGGWFTDNYAFNNSYNKSNDDIYIEGQVSYNIYAKWTPKTYTITYNASGGSVTPTSFTKTFDTAYAGDLAVPTKTGYTFDNWYSDGLYTVLYDKTTDAIYEENKTTPYNIYAKWTANTYNVEFNVGSSGATAPAAITKTYAAALASELPNPTSIPDGYEFLGWYKESTFNNQWNGAENDDLSSTAGATVTVYAKWRMGIVYNANGHGTAPETKTITGTETYNLPTMTATGYTFGGWYNEATCENLVGQAGASYTATAARTLYAKWTAKTYTINYNANGGTVDPATFEKTYDTVITTDLAVPTKTGYTFDGWYTTSALNVVYDKTTDTIYKDGQTTYNIYAKWVAKNYTINYNANGGTITGDASFTKTYATAFAGTLTSPKREGYTFGGWFTDNNTFANSYNKSNDAIYEEGQTTPYYIYAKWTAITYTVTYNVNRGSWADSYTAPANWTVENASTTNLPTSANITRPHYIFEGWYENSDLSGDQLTSLVGKTANLTLYAKWSLDTSGTYHTITFNSNGGSGNMETQYAFEGEETTLYANTFTRSGYTFSRWKLDDTTYYSNTANIGEVISDLTLYAEWTKNPSPAPRPSNNNRPPGGGGGGGGSGGGGIPAGTNPLNNTPATTQVSQGKSISGVVNSNTSTWTSDPLSGKYKLNILDASGNQVPVSNGFYMVTNTVTQVVNNVPIQTQVNNTYYFDTQGNMVTGWVQTADNKWFFFENAKTADEGKMSLGWKQVQGLWYYFTPDGSMMENGITPDGFIIGADGRWIG